MAAVAENSSGNHFINRSHRLPCDQGTDYKAQRDVNKLVEILSKLNPLAKEFFPSSYTPDERKSGSPLTPNAPVFVASSNNCSSANGRPSDNRPLNLRTRNGYNQGRRRMTERVRRAEREESIRRTVYVSDIDQNVTEEQLAELFTTCGQVVDCRACGDPHSILRFAFIEFADEYGARAALSLGGTMLGFYPVKVLPSKTAILPVNPKFLPRSNDEREMVVRTVYCTNIDKKIILARMLVTDLWLDHAFVPSHVHDDVELLQVTQSEIKLFFQQVCGEVSRLRLLGDNVHSTRIAFVEFLQAESAILALNCSGMILGSLPIRISPSKTPVRPRIPRATSA